MSAPAGFAQLPLLDGGRYRWQGGDAWAFAGASFPLAAGATNWVLVADGPCQLTTPQGSFALLAGMFAVVPAGGQLAGGRGLVIESPGYRGLFQIGGPAEPAGRLRYIDGCTDTLLVCPPRLGEPCLNHLHLPAGTLQSHHTHPSDRVGIVARGRGWACAGGQRVGLQAGMAWRIAAGTAHHFETDGETLDVLAWHPDSDFGPTDEAHPMLNRTFLAARP